MLASFLEGSCRLGKEDLSSDVTTKGASVAVCHSAPLCDSAPPCLSILLLGSSMICFSVMNLCLLKQQDNKWASLATQEGAPLPFSRPVGSDL